MTTGKIPGDTYVKDGKAFEVGDFVPDMSGEIYYEVVRLMDGKLLFLEDHLERLARSLAGSGIAYPGSAAVKESLRLLLQNNAFSVGNIRICIRDSDVDENSITCYFIPYSYPEECVYKSGVQIVTYPHVRPNPGIKKWDDSFRVSVSDYIREHGVYEVILLNDLLQITEGSRSNIFFLDKTETLVSPPEPDILPGITRKYVLRISRGEGIAVEERPVYYNEAGDMVACFISGTSPKILPVWQLDGFQFNAGHPVLETLMERFEELIQKHLAFRD